MKNLIGRFIKKIREWPCKYGWHAWSNRYSIISFSKSKQWCMACEKTIYE